MPAAQSRGFTLIEMMITVVIITVLVSLGYPMYQTQVQTTRQTQLREAMMSAASGAERTLVATGSYPTALAPDYADRYTYTYTRATGGRAFVLKGSDSKLKLWAGLNSAGSRCTCRKCDPPAATAFTDGTLACPSGTDAF